MADEQANPTTLDQLVLAVGQLAQKAAQHASADRTEQYAKAAKDLAEAAAWLTAPNQSH